MGGHLAPDVEPQHDAIEIGVIGRVVQVEVVEDDTLSILPVVAFALVDQALLADLVGFCARVDSQPTAIVRIVIGDDDSKVIAKDPLVIAVVRRHVLVGIENGEEGGVEAGNPPQQLRGLWGELAILFEEIPGFENE